MTQISQSQVLYEQDILLWVEDTVAKLKARDFEAVDWENVIEEIEAVGISQKRELLSRLVVLLEHLLKREFVNLPRNYGGWERTIRTQRTRLKILLKQVPSLKTRWESSFDDAWKIALEAVHKEYPQTEFPDRWPHERTLQEMLDRDFWLEIS
jgi:hypothetical protein